MSRKPVTPENKRRPRAVPFSNFEWDIICRAATFKHLRPSNFIQVASLTLADKTLTKK